MSLRERLTDYSLGNDLRLYWKLFYRRGRTKSRLRADLLTFFLNRMAHRRGGYIGRGAQIAAIPSLPHGLHGIYISRYAKIGRGCLIYQNVTIGEVGGKAPEIGENCLVGAGACIVGGVRIGSNVKIGAGAVVAQNIPDNSTVVSPAPRVIVKG